MKLVKFTSLTKFVHIYTVGLKQILGEYLNIQVLEILIFV